MRRRTGIWLPPLKAHYLRTVALLLALALAATVGGPPGHVQAALLVDATVAVGSFARGVGVNATTNKIYVSNYAVGTVSVIDGATNTVIDTDGIPGNGITPITVGANPFGVAVNSTTNKIYVANYGGTTVSVIDGGSDTVTATVTVGTKPWHLAVNATTNMVYVVSDTTRNVDVIDVDNSNSVSTVTVGTSGTKVWGVAVNATTNKIYVAIRVDNNVEVIDGDSASPNYHTVTETVAVGTGPSPVGVNATTNRIYVGNDGGATVSVLYYVPTVTTAAITITGVTLDGTDQTVSGSTSAWRADATGEISGWNVTVASTDFDSAGKTIAVANFEIQLLDANIAYVSGSDSIDIPVSTQTTFAALSGSALKIASAASGEGDGVYDMTPGFQLTVPAETYTGSYTATVTVAINVGP